jgi:hypothetical protein
MPTPEQIAAVMMDLRAVAARDTYHAAICAVAAEKMAPPVVTPPVTPPVVVPPVIPPVVVPPIVVPPGRYITDALAHPPPMSGAFGYNTFKPGASGFPAVGGTYVDPVFGATVRRLTNEVGSQSDSEIYSRNGFFNADGTLMHHRTPSGHAIIDTATGAVVRKPPVMFNDQSSFDPVDPDAWWSFDKSGSSPVLTKYSVSRPAQTTTKTLPGNLGQNGGSVDWIDRSGRYMVLSVGGATRVYDVQGGALYAGAIPGSYGGGGGWFGISPDGNYVITSTPQTSSTPPLSHSWWIDHATKAVRTTPVLFWTLGGGHADIVSASNGKTYFVGWDSHTTSDVYAVDVSLPQTHANVTQQLAQNKKLVVVGWSDQGHFSRVSRGALQDWCFASIESGESAVWRPYQQEILMMNVLTQEVRRLAHHRSRITSSYVSQPRVGAAWDGRVVCWTSNFGAGGSGYADLYALTP